MGNFHSCFSLFEVALLRHELPTLILWAECGKVYGPQITFLYEMIDLELELDGLLTLFMKYIC